MTPERVAPEVDAQTAAHFRGRRVVVTGGRGFFGGWVTAALREIGAEVVALSSRDYDLTDSSAALALYTDLRPSVVLHLAAACGGIAANVANPGRFLVANAQMGCNVLEGARRAGIDRVVLVSTTCAYPRDAALPLRETSLWDGPPVGATGPYGMAKRLLHEAWATYHRQYGLPGVVVLPANLYGPRDHFDPENSHVVPALIRRYVEATAARSPEVVNWGTGRPTREFLHARDAAAGLLHLAARVSDGQTINLGTGIETSIAALTELVASATGFQGAVRWDPSRPDGQPRRVLCTARAEALGYVARTPLEAGVLETIEWYRAEVLGKDSGD